MALTGDWVGLGDQEQDILQSIASGRMPHAWLLAGPRGRGKAAFARRFATFILDGGVDRAANGSRDFATAFSGTAAHLIAAGSHPDLIILEREPTAGKSDREPKAGAALARNIRVDQVRNVIAKLHVHPSQGDWRVVIVDSVDDMERSAANAILKSLEEPPRGTVFLLVSHSPDRLLPTIRSRCRQIRFPALTRAEVIEWLDMRLPDTDERTRNLLTRFGEGAPGQMLELAEGQGIELAELVLATHQGRMSSTETEPKLAAILSNAHRSGKFDALVGIARTLLVEEAAASPEGRSAVFRRYDQLEEICDGRSTIGDDPALLGRVIARILVDVASPAAVA